ncbi:magnesium/cobalt transporter CorA [Candidatus Woesearchaeota archaeon]|nr:magnesium/cobalt transporter CorA [Candidatus Woesearchaeota archaeon]
MITVWERDPSKKGVRTVRLEHWKKQGSMSWIDCVEPTSSELDSVSRIIGVPVVQLRGSMDPNKRPRVFSYGKYSLITFRGVTEDNKRLSSGMLGIFVTQGIVLTIHGKSMEWLDDIRALPAEQQRMLLSNVCYLVYRVMDAIVGDFFEYVDQIETEIDKVEEQVLREPTRLVTKGIFVQKRSLIYMHKALTANRDVISAIEKNYVPELDKADIRVFRDLYTDVAQLLDMVSTYRDVLTSVLDMYLSSVSNNLNKIMKTLTLLSAFVMVPTLISGIYGMNFKNMPELMWPYGYLFSIGVMMFSVVIFYYYFKKKGWIEWP